MPAINAPVYVLDLTLSQLEDYMRLLGEPASGAGRILKGVFRENAAGFEEMTCLNRTLKEKLAQNASLGALEPLEERLSEDAQTRKVLFRLEDGRTVEAALMFFRNPRTGRERRTVCLSTQVGCAVGCPFCATGQQGFERNLSPGEIINQILFFLRRGGNEAPERGKNASQGWLTNVVFMGMGEPLANFDNVRQAIAMLNSGKGMNLGYNQVTLSTAGLAPQISRLAGENLQFQLAVSLHAADDELRDRLVPINRKYPLARVISACKEYVSRTRRKVFIEYALFQGINDSMNDAAGLACLLNGLSCSVNLILGNRTLSNEFKPSTREAALAFQQRLMSGGIRTMLRVSRGADIEAGCGQLRSRWLEKQQPADDT
jgi:23S rRNA (adenine2503-C2)-methyltransferase